MPLDAAARCRDGDEAFERSAGYLAPFEVQVLKTHPRVMREEEYRSPSIIISLGVPAFAVPEEFHAILVRGRLVMMLFSARGSIMMRAAFWNDILYESLFGRVCNFPRLSHHRTHFRTVEAQLGDILH